MFKLIALIGLVAATLAAPAPQIPGLTLQSLGLQQLGLQRVPQLQLQPLHQTVPVSLQPTSLIPAINPSNIISAQSPDGSSVHGFQTIDGQVRQETTAADGSRHGSYSYLDASGQKVVVHYVADQHGYRSSNDPVSIALGSTAPRPTTTSTPAPSPMVALQHHLSLPHQPILTQNPFQFTLTGR